MVSAPASCIEFLLPWLPLRMVFITATEGKLEHPFSMRAPPFLLLHLHMSDPRFLLSACKQLSIWFRPLSDVPVHFKKIIFFACMCSLFSPENLLLSAVFCSVHFLSPYWTKSQIPTFEACPVYLKFQSNAHKNTDVGI